MNGMVPIKEKGPGFFAIVDVLHRCLTEDPRDTVRATLHPVLPGCNLILHKSVSKLD